jgi:beta-glucanase (GH16 family)
MKDIFKQMNVFINKNHIMLYNNFKKKLIVFLIIILSKNLYAQHSYKKLVWSDEFNGKSELPDTSKWSFDLGNGCPGLCGWGNNELEYYTRQRNENCRVENGRLIIEARKEDFNNAQYTSARLVTKNKGDWKYGRFDIRAKLPSGRGIWPAIWMLPTKLEYGQWPLSGEIDIVENVGYFPDSLFGTLHTESFNGMKGTQKVKSISAKDLSTAFHNYTLEWDENKISFYLDNVLYHVFENNHTGFEAWPFDKVFHLVLNVAVGGNWGGKYGVDDSIFPQKMEVDYIRVYQ